MPRRRGYDLHEALRIIEEEIFRLDKKERAPSRKPKPKRKLSAWNKCAWNKYVKANSKKPRFRLRSGSPNLKKLGVAFRKTPAGKKKRR